MASGKPVLACDTGGVPEVVLHGETGLLVRPHDLDAIEGAIATLAADAELRAAIWPGRPTPRRRTFSVARYLDTCERHYRELLPRATASCD